ncbi:MAG TPA: sn-glycerol-1-phosphate dehydrogenase [Usitatibacter sp.]|nr:sn-glycerol-1-phosphate dehydrogenase [Usitatibacter sp.]
MSSVLQGAVRNAAVTREVEITRGVVSALPAAASRCVPGGRWLVVADETTWKVAGAAAQAELERHGTALAPFLVLPARPRLKPREETAQHIASRLRAEDAAPIAVGSGVINDLVKYAAALAQRPYICIATAASMDGYAASGAALLDGGFKRTLPCAPPWAVLADPDVLAAAPARMTGWGFGDLAGKCVAGADWILADTLGVEALAPQPFALVQDHLRDWIGRPDRLAARDPAAMGVLLEGLLISGFAMQAHHNSRPASGSEHQFSHLWEMENLQVDGEPAAHGACVGVGCVAMLALYEWLFARDADEIRHARAGDARDAQALACEIGRALGSGPVAAAAQVEMREKQSTGSPGDRIARFVATWPRLRGELASRLMPAHEMQARLRALGAAAHPADLGIDLATLAADYRRARLIRRRYTLLDLLEDLGWLDRAVAELFAAHGFWGRQSIHSAAHAAGRIST